MGETSTQIHGAVRISLIEKHHCASDVWAHVLEVDSTAEFRIMEIGRAARSEVDDDFRNTIKNTVIVLANQGENFVFGGEGSSDFNPWRDSFN